MKIKLKKLTPLRIAIVVVGMVLLLTFLVLLIISFTATVSKAFSLTVYIFQCVICLYVLVMSIFNLVESVKQKKAAASQAADGKQDSTATEGTPESQKSE